MDKLSTKLKIYGKGSAVWAVPGNHDVDWTVIDKSPLLQDIQAYLKPEDKESIDKLINDILRDAAKKDLLYQPLSNYNKYFGSFFECSIDAEHPQIVKDVILNDKSILRIHGVNSALVSYNHDNNAANKLTIGRFQATMSSEYGVTDILMCHHPLPFLRDSDFLGDHWNARARIQLFGHKHQQRITQINSSLIIAAGATHPSRREIHWLPRYNLLEIRVDGIDTARTLNVNVYARVWDEEDQKFKPQYSEEGKIYSGYQLKLDDWSLNLSSDDSIVSEQSYISGKTETEIQMDTTTKFEEKVTISNVIDPARILTYRYLRLPYVTKLKIAQDLNLLKDEDQGLSDSDLFVQIFRRAHEELILDELWNSVEKAHGILEPSDNPFKGQSLNKKKNSSKAKD